MEEKTIDVSAFDIGDSPSLVSVELPISVGILPTYVPDQNMRLRLYRRLADLPDEAALDALEEEFRDRFGNPPDTVHNLIYQIRVKLRAETAGLASVSVDSHQLVLRFPPLPEGMQSRELPNIGHLARSGKNAYWLPMEEDRWKNRLLDTLSAIIDLYGRIY